MVPAAKSLPSFIRKASRRCRCPRDGNSIAAAKYFNGRRRELRGENGVGGTFLPLEDCRESFERCGKSMACNGLGVFSGTIRKQG